MLSKKCQRKKVAKGVIAVFLALAVVGLVAGDLMAMGRLQDTRGSEQKTWVQLNSSDVVHGQSGHTLGGGLGCIPRADEILSVSESWSLPGLHVEKGTMNVYVDIPQPLPIYIDSDVVSTWNVTYEVYGGYLPTTGYYVDVLQNVTRHQIPYSLVLVGQEPDGAMVYRAVFSVEPFYLNSDQYPIVTVAGQTFGAGHGYVPGLDVSMLFDETWTVGEDPSRTFTIISARTARFLGDIAPNPPSPSPCPLAWAAVD
jgi:hypothetical protein